MTRYFVQVYYHTDGDFSCEHTEELIPLHVDPHNEDKNFVGDFSTFQEAIEVVQKQYMRMVDTLKGRAFEVPCFIRCWTNIIVEAGKALSRDDGQWGQTWNTGNQYGGVLISQHEQKDVIETVKQHLASVIKLGEILSHFGFAVDIRSFGE